MFECFRAVLGRFSRWFQTPKGKRPRSRLKGELLEDRLNPSGSLAGSFDLADAIIPITTLTSQAASTASTIQSVALTSVVTPIAAPRVTANALVLSTGKVVPLIQTNRTTTPTAIGFVKALDNTVTAYNEKGEVLWAKKRGPGNLFSGFDMNGDRIPDFGIVRVTPVGRMWGGSIVNQSSIDFYSGVNGNLAGRTAVQPDLLWSFEGGATYATQQLALNTVLFGAGTTLLVSPQYATIGSFLNFNGNALSATGEFYFPSSSEYDFAYLAAQPNPFDGSTAHFASSHVANGLIVDTPTGPTAVFWTTGRVVQYRVGAIDPEQLIADSPYLNGDRSDLAGRNYGLVVQDPAYPDHVSLLAGTSTLSVYKDIMSGKITADPWGGIERHVEVYSVSGANPLQHRFYSYAHDNGGAGRYQNRLVFPANPYISGAPGTPSRLAYNVLANGRWNLHITDPGSTNVARIIPNTFLWDIKDLNRKGKAVLITSPTRVSLGTKATRPYFPQWKTVLSTWQEATQTLKSGMTINNAIPLIRPHSRTPAASSTEGNLFPVSIASVEGIANLIMTTSTGEQLLVDVSSMR